MPPHNAGDFEFNCPHDYSHSKPRYDHPMKGPADSPGFFHTHRSKRCLEV
ncbi:hypothetical protein ACVWZ4_001281 [Bradyrhizobium sp. USDA 4472]